MVPLPSFEGSTRGSDGIGGGGGGSVTGGLGRVDAINDVIGGPPRA
jgi:hypothetical protein